MPTIYNQFDTGASAALVDRLRVYLWALGDSCQVKVVGQSEKQVQEKTLVVVSATELEEVIYQSGHYRAAVEVTVKVDMDTGTEEQFVALSGGVLDALQQVDLVAQLNAVKDETGRALCVVQGLVLNQSRLEDIGERQWRRVYALDVFGFNPGS